MTSKVKPIGGGAPVDITKVAGTQSASKTNAVLAALPSGWRAHALRAMNEWIYAGGTGSGSTRAQKTAAAVGIQLSEV